jgi:hypothetical protein
MTTETYPEGRWAAWAPYLGMFFGVRLSGSGRTVCNIKPPAFVVDRWADSACSLFLRGERSCHSI